MNDEAHDQKPWLTATLLQCTYTSTVCRTGPVQLECTSVGCMHSPGVYAAQVYGQLRCMYSSGVRTVQMYVLLGCMCRVNIRAGVVPQDKSLPNFRRNAENWQNSVRERESKQSKSDHGSYLKTRTKEVFPPGMQSQEQCLGKNSVPPARQGTAEAADN